MRSTFDIVLMSNSYTFPSKLVSWINKAKEHAIVVTTDLEIQKTSLSARPNSATLPLIARLNSMMYSSTRWLILLSMVIVDW